LWKAEPLKRREKPGSQGRENAPEIAGFLVYAPQGANPLSYWSALEAAGSKNQVILRPLKGTQALINAIIPESLQRDAHSWLVLHRSDGEQELLILPYPDAVMIRQHLTTGGIERHAFLTLEEIRGERERRWFAAIGYSNLSRLRAGTTGRPHTPELHINRFQVICIDRPLNDLLHHETSDREKKRRVFLRASSDVQGLRSSTLASVLEAKTQSSIDDTLRKFEDAVVERNIRLAENLVESSETTALGKLPSAFSDLLDPASRKFLMSSEAVKHFAMTNLFDDFDYSLPGSGLWKTIENELNLSLVWYFRIQHGVADATSPWMATCPPLDRVEINTGYGQSLNLNEREGGNTRRLRGVMLGPLQYLLRAGYSNGLAGGLSNLAIYVEQNESLLLYMLGPSDKRAPEEGTLPWFLRKLSYYRNRHAHIEAMTRQVFEQFEALVLSPQEDPWSSQLGKILEIKRSVLEHLGNIQARRESDET
jgi:hypothetical protein